MNRAVVGTVSLGRPCVWVTGAVVILCSEECVTFLSEGNESLEFSAPDVVRLALDISSLEIDYFFKD